MAAKAKKEAEAPPEAADAANDAEGAESTGKKLPLKMIIIAAAGAVVVIGGGIGGYFMFAPAKVHQPAAVVAKPATFIDVPEVLVNLSNTGSERTQYLKVKVVLELPDEKLKEAIQPVMPRVLDAFQTYLRELRPTDLDGSAGL
ncbi:MAG: flagellar basal body-associated FliL family protein, partial [Proteobacteria bacterium]|nr:flagellar basal body-associated FliL family protein [Pseudomonadota bacterium]